MDEEYDAIILGTGLKECLLAGVLSKEGYKILHLDRNAYYGAESASLNLKQLFEKFRPEEFSSAKGGENSSKESEKVFEEKLKEKYGRWQDWNIDMVPKMMMGNGLLVKLLVHTGVHNYVSFKASEGSYVFKQGKLFKVPATDKDALRSPLMGMFEKLRARSFFVFVQDYDETRVETHKGYDLRTMTSRQLYKEYGLADETIEFIGHALALYTDERYMDFPAIHMVKAVKLYEESLARFNTGSPYIYPLYGLGELPQGFARLSAVYGGTYMLNKPDAEVEWNEETGEAIGVSATMEDETVSAGEGEEKKGRQVVTAKAKHAIVGDPSYFPKHSVQVGSVARALCFLSHPIDNVENAHSVQIIIPASQVGRKNDVYVFGCSYMHNVCAKGRYVAFVSTNVETANPEQELASGLSLLGTIDEKFVHICPIMAPTTDGIKEKAIISRGYDATTHFESTVRDVLDMYRRVTGKQLDLSQIDANEASTE